MLPAPNAQRSQLRKIETIKAAANEAVEALNAAIETTWPADHVLFFNLWVARTAFCKAARQLPKATKTNEARAFSEYRKARRAYKEAHEMIFGW